jgi:tRNA(Ile)-lysidine synthase
MFERKRRPKPELEMGWQVNTKVAEGIRMQEILDKIVKTIKRNGMITEGDKVCVAVSGGPDSIALLHYLSNLKDRLNITLSVQHINHMLRGVESDADERFVSETADKLSIPFVVTRIDVKKYRSAAGGSIQSSARELRYRTFGRLIEKGEADRVALAHTADDSAETVLMNLLRGSGHQGLSGIPAVREGLFIRPMIDVWKKDILKSLSKNSIHFRIDRSNEDTKYLRNRVRLELVPYLEKNYNPEITAALNRTASLSGDVLKFIGKIASEELDKSVVKEGRGEAVLDINLVAKLDPALQRELLRQAIEKVKGFSRGIFYRNIEDLRSLILSDSSGELNLPGLVCVKSGEKLMLHTGRETASPYSYRFRGEGDVVIDEAGCVVHIEEVESGRVEFDSSCMEVFVDADALPGDTVFRNRKDGDRFRPLGGGGSQKLKDFFVNNKVARWERDKLPLLASGSDILWIPGMRLSENIKLQTGTKRFIRMEYIRSEEV